MCVCVCVCVCACVCIIGDETHYVIMHLPVMKAIARINSTCFASLSVKIPAVMEPIKYPTLLATSARANSSKFVWVSLFISGSVGPTSSK